MRIGMTAVMREKQITHSLAKSLPIPIHQQFKCFKCGRIETSCSVEKLVVTEHKGGQSVDSIQHNSQHNVNDQSADRE